MRHTTLCFVPCGARPWCLLTCDDTGNGCVSTSLSYDAAHLMKPAHKVQMRQLTRREGSAVRLITIAQDAQAGQLRSFGKGFRSFLRHIVIDALEDAVLICAREQLAIGCSVRGRTIEISTNG